jgi:hypothetical protein
MKIGGLDTTAANQVSSQLTMYNLMNERTKLASKEMQWSEA